MLLSCSEGSEWHSLASFRLQGLTLMFPNSKLLSGQRLRMTFHLKKLGSLTRTAVSWHFRFRMRPKVENKPSRGPFANRSSQGHRTMSHRSPEYALKECRKQHESRESACQVESSVKGQAQAWKEGQFGKTCHTGKKKTMQTTLYPGSVPYFLDHQYFKVEI